MRYDILNTDSDASRLVAVLRESLGAVDEPDRFGSGSHLKAPNGGRLYVSPSLTDSGQADVTLHSDLADDEHNAWAVGVFHAVRGATDGDVTLFDQDDGIVMQAARAYDCL